MITNQQRAQLLAEFIMHCKDTLQIERLPKMEFVTDNSWAKQNKSFGGYIPANNTLIVYIGNRNLADSMRTIAHELCHHRQNELGMLDVNSGKTGSPIENQANSIAAVIMREYGKEKPLIYENKTGHVKKTIH